jgi:membrane protease YdiL (CAAX protease family)
VSTPPPYPGPLQALLLAVLGWLLAGLAATAAADLVTPTAALGIGTVLGFGAAGALGATHVPPPHAERLGLRGLRLAQLPPLLLMVPLALLASEVDNTMRSFFPPPDAQKLAQQVFQRVPTHGDLALLESLVVVVGLVPVVEEWFFRGVLQQGLVARLGKGAGVFLCALLFAVGHGGPELSAASWAAVVTQILVLGLAFGWVREVSGSLVGAIVLHAGVNLAGVLAMAAEPVLAVPGYNAAGAHTPLVLLAPSAVAVVGGAAWLRRVAPRPFAHRPPGRQDEPPPP